MGFRAFIVGIPLVAATVADERVGLAAALLYVLAYTLELSVSLLTYFNSEPSRVRRLAHLGLAGLARARAARGRGRVGATGGEEEKFNPALEWTLHDVGPIHLGPLDLSINKAVAYLLLGTIVSCADRDRPHARQASVGAHEPAPGARRDALRGRPGAGGRAGTADEGDRPLVPLRRDADALHLGDQHARLHPAAALGREGRDRRCRAADARHLRRHLDPLGDARARADDVDLHARRGHSRERGRRLLQELDPRRPEGDATR